FLPLGHILTVALWIHKRVFRAAFLDAQVFLLHGVVASVSSQKYITRKRFQNLKRLCEVFTNRRIFRVSNESIARVHIRTSDHHHIVGAPSVACLQRPGRTAFSMARGSMSHQDRITQLHLVPVSQDLVDRTRLPDTIVLEISLSSSANNVFVAL